MQDTRRDRERRKAWQFLFGFEADERITEVQRKRLMYEKNRINRILESYPFDEETALKKAMELIDSFSREEFYHLLSEGYLDYIVVEGKRRFEERFVHNIAFALPLYRERLKKDPVAQKARDTEYAQR